MRTVARWVFVLTFTVALAAQVPAAWQNWKYSAAIQIQPGSSSSGGFVALVVPATVTSHSRTNWTDLRVIDAQGAEVPFILHARIGGTVFERRRVPLLEPSQVKGAYQQAIADAGDKTTVHNSVKLHIQTVENLLTWVEIAVSADLRGWRVVRERAPIYVLRAEGMGENTDVSYPDSISRYVRIRILDGSDHYSLGAVDLGRELSTVAERVPAGITLAASTSRTGQSVWLSDGDATAFPLSRVDFKATQASFFRSARVESSDDGTQWRPAGRGDILRAPDNAGTRDWLTVDIPETHARLWRITVDNRNDAPVAGLSPALLMAPRRVVLKPEPGTSYRLLYGNPRAQAPNYDLARLVDTRRLDAAADATLGPEQENAAWVDPSPWTERHETVLWVALGLALVALGGVAVRTLRT